MFNLWLKLDRQCHLLIGVIGIGGLMAGAGMSECERIQEPEK